MSRTHVYRDQADGYPYLRFARENDIPYGIVLSRVDAYKNIGFVMSHWHSEAHKFFETRMPTLRALLRVIDGEAYSRTLPARPKDV